MIKKALLDVGHGKDVEHDVNVVDACVEYVMHKKTKKHKIGEIMFIIVLLFIN